MATCCRVARIGLFGGPGLLASFLLCSWLHSWHSRTFRKLPLKPVPSLPACRCQRVIYHLLEEVGELVAGVAPRVAHEVVVGSAEVLQVFHLKGAR